MSEKNKSLELRKETAIRHYDLGKPAELTSMALVLQKHITAQNLFTKIKGKNYAHVEGWQFAGGLLGVLPKVTEVLDLSTDKEKKYRATVILYTADGKEVGRGDGLCSSLETQQTKNGAYKRWADEYAVLSMAQTRAIGKAYRNTIGWVMKMAHYEGTPAEEIKEINLEETGNSSAKAKSAEIFISPETKEKLIRAGILSGIFQSADKMLKSINKTFGVKLVSIDEMTEAQGRQFLRGLLQKNTDENK